MSHKEIVTYGLYPQYVSNPKERELRITKVKKMSEETWDDDTEYDDWYIEYCKAYSHIYKLDHEYDPLSTFEL